MGIESQSRQYQYRMNGSSSSSSVPATTRLKHHNKGPLLKRLPDLLLEAAGWLAGWAAGGVVDNFCDTELGVGVFFDMVEWPGGGLVEQCS